MGVVATLTGRMPDGTSKIPLSPMDYYGELLAMTWDQVINNDGDPNFGAYPGSSLSHFREYIDGVATTLDNSDLVANRRVDLSGISTFGLSTVNNDSIFDGTHGVSLWPLLPILDIFPGSGHGPYSGQSVGDLQSSFWKYAVSGPETLTDYKTVTLLQRNRYRFNRISPYGFFARLDVYSLVFDDVEPFPVHVGADYHNFLVGCYIVQPSLISTRGPTPAMTWIEPPVFPIPTVSQSFQSGYLGQIVFSVDWETPAMWTVRTGISFI